MLRKGAGLYLRERLVRLGIPLLVCGALIGPLTQALAHSASWQALWPMGWRWLQKEQFVIGPLWFVWALLLFTGAAVLYSCIRPPMSQPHTTPLPAPSRWWLAALPMGTVALALRQWAPVGPQVLGLQIGYAASYAFLFGLGYHAQQRGWLGQLSPRHARYWAAVSVCALVLLPLALYASCQLEGPALPFATGVGLLAVFYVFWEPLLAWVIIASLLLWARQGHVRYEPYWLRGSQLSYGAFIVHAPVLMAIARTASAWPVHPLLQWWVVANLSTALSFALAALLRQLPLARRVL